jgi:1-acyl-sn-glycerol-3-phosphate acyltransferase
VRIPANRYARRLITLPVVFLLVVVLTVGLVLVPLTLLFDLLRWMVTRRPFMATRLLVFGWLYVVLDTMATLALFVSWLVSGFGLYKPLLFRLSYWAQKWWALAVFGAFRLVLRVRLEMEGDEVIAPGPVSVMVRHVSIIDTLLPIVAGSRHGMIPRYVLKKELLVDPPLDIAGNWIPNYFIDRTGESAAEVGAVAALAAGMGPREMLVIYPEGTRFTEDKRRRALKRLERSGSAFHDRAARLERVLPPRPGGAMALLDAGHDVVIGMHTGLEALGTVSDAWAGGVVGSTARVRFVRYPAADIPPDRAGRLDWLFERWAEIDAWLAGE